VGPRTYLLAGTEARGGLRTLATILARTATMARRSPTHWSLPGYRDLFDLRRDSDGLVVDSPNWEEGAAFGREWAWVAASALLWRLGGKQTLVRERALPRGAGLRDRVVRAALRSVARS
jgi:hypothetical protein